MYSIHIVGTLAPYAAVIVPLGAQTRNIPQTTPVIISRVEKVRFTNEKIEQFNIIVKKCMNGSISMEEAALKLCGGGKFKDISFIALYIWLYRLQNNHVQGFQPDPRSKRFGNLISFLRTECDNFEEDYDNKEFYFLKLQKSLDKELDTLE